MATVLNFLRMSLATDTMAIPLLFPSSNYNVIPGPAGRLLDPALWQLSSDWSGPIVQLSYILTFIHGVSLPPSKLADFYFSYLFFQISWFVRGPWNTWGGWCDNSEGHSRHQWHQRWQTVGRRWGEVQSVLSHVTWRRWSPRYHLQAAFHALPALSATRGQKASSSSFSLMLLSLSSNASVWGFPGGSKGKESACNEGDLGSVPGLGRSPGEGNDCLLQYSCLENPMDRGALQAIDLVTKSQTRLSRHAFTFQCLYRPTLLESGNNCKKEIYYRKTINTHFPTVYYWVSLLLFEE